MGLDYYKTHYREEDRAVCNTLPSYTAPLRLTQDWDLVSCRRCMFHHPIDNLRLKKEWTSKREVKKELIVMDERDKEVKRDRADHAADKFFNVKFEGRNVLGNDTYSGSINALDRNRNHRRYFIAGFKESKK